MALAGLFPSLHGYRRSWLRPDLLAGLTVRAVLVPEAPAYAGIAGVPSVVVLDAETSPFIDVGAARMPADLRDAQARDGVRLLIARDTGQFRDTLDRAVPGRALPVYPTVREAISDARGG